MAGAALVNVEVRDFVAGTAPGAHCHAAISLPLYHCHTVITPLHFLQTFGLLAGQSFERPARSTDRQDPSPAP